MPGRMSPPLICGMSTFILVVFKGSLGSELYDEIIKYNKKENRDQGVKKKGCGSEYNEISDQTGT